MGTEQRNSAIQDRLSRIISSVLVVWVPPSADSATRDESHDSEESIWTQTRTALSQAVKSLLTNSNDTETELSSLEQANEATAKVAYCTSEWKSVEEAIRRAAAQKARQVVIVPMAFTVDDPHTRGAPVRDLTAQLSKLEIQMPDMDIIYVGPPFDPERQLQFIFGKIHEYESQKAELLPTIILHGFKGDWSLFTRFMEKLQKALPPDTNVAIRGSAVTGYSWVSGRPFDALGPGTSDLDIVLIGEQIMAEWQSDAFYVSDVNTMPLSDKKPDIAPRLNPVRVKLQEIAGRPVNIQAMTKWFLELRYRLLGQPYLILD